MGFTFKLQTRDGVPADPPTLVTVAPSWRPGDTIPLGRRTLRVGRQPRVLEPLVQRIHVVENVGVVRL
jgi:hypothetical protein